MPKPEASLSVLESACAELLKIADQIAVESGYLRSCLAGAATCSPTVTEERSGDGSAPATTGLTDGIHGVLVEEVVTILKPYLQGPNPARLAETLAMQIVSALVSLSSVSGGGESQPLPSDRPQHNWPGASSDPTRQAAPSAPTMTTTFTDWRDALRMGVAHLSGIVEKSAPTLDTGNRLLWNQVVSMLHGLTDPSRM